MTCGSDDIDTCRPTIDIFKKTFDLLKLSYVGSIEALGCEDKGDIKEAYKKKTKKLADSLA
jgi:hypothetical protein